MPATCDVDMNTRLVKRCELQVFSLSLPPHHSPSSLPHSVSPSLTPSLTLTLSLSLSLSQDKPQIPSAGWGQLAPEKPLRKTSISRVFGSHICACISDDNKQLVSIML